MENYKQSPWPRDMNQPVQGKIVVIFDVYVYDSVCIFIIEQYGPVSFFSI